MVVILNDSLQIIDNPMEENIVVRNRGGGCIVKNPPLFSADGKYVYVLCGCCISVYSLQTGEHTHDYLSKNKEEFVYIATFQKYLLGVTAEGHLIAWNTNRVVPEKFVKLELPENTSVVQLHTVPGGRRDIDFSLLLALRPNDKRDLQLYHYSVGGKLLANLYARVENKPHSLSVCDDFVAVIKKDRLTVVPFSKNQEKNSMLAGGGRLWTAVACALVSGGVAAGDDSGRILYWPQALHSNARGVFHWHTLPVQTISFSPSGSYMYSGGGEGVMVRWNVEAPNVRNFMPRQPAPILHLVVSGDNQYVAIATQDNGIQVVDGQNKVNCVIQRLTWGVTPVAGQTLFPAGLVWDPRSRSIVLNGRPGHLQFFSSDDDKLLYNLDITGQNYLSQERAKEIFNVEVTRVAVSYDGKWLVTVETRDDHQTCCNSLLKFWQYKFNARQFSLNTCIQQPHEGSVTAVKFQPVSVSADSYLLITTGRDAKFRLWLPAVSESIHSEGLRWVCESVGHYRSLSPECTTFSADGSVLGVSFGPTLTLWDVEVCQLSTSLTRDNRVLRAVEFGSHEYCHLVVTASAAELCVWSVLTLTIMWAVTIRVSLLCADPLSSYMAVFTDESSVFVFSPSGPTPVYQRRKLCKPGTDIVGAIFVPRPHKLMDTSATWCASSHLHFIDTNQDLQYLELDSVPEPGPIVRRPTAYLAPVTPFNTLAAKQATSAVERQQGVQHQQLGTAGDAAVRMLLKNPASTMPHIHLFCKSFLKSLVINRKCDGEKKVKEEPEFEIRMDIDQDSESDNISKQEESNLDLSKHQDEDVVNNSPKKELKELPSRKKQRRKSMKDKRSPKKENSFTFDDLDTDWLSILEST